MGLRSWILESEKEVMVQEGKIRSWCFWLKDTVDDCRYPCSEGEGMKTIKECPHFKTFWAKRLSELQSMRGKHDNNR